MALLYTALAAGAMGLVAAVATSDHEMRERVRGSVGDDQRRLLEDCEQCVAFMREVGVEVPEELSGHPQLNMCNKIAMLPAEKLEAIMRKFLGSDKIRKEKLAALAQSCRGEACAKIRIFQTTRESGTNCRRGARGCCSRTRGCYGARR